MARLDIEVRRNPSELVTQTLPDGSTAIFEVPTKNVYSLNPSAAAAWEACASATRLSEIATDMSRRLSAPVTQDLAHAAVSELAAAGLVTLSGEAVGSSRRDVLKQVAGMTFPVVLVLTGAEQRAHAQVAASTPVTTTVLTTVPLTTTPAITTTPAFELCQSFTIHISKGVDQPGGGTIPLAGVVFKLFDPSNNEVATLTTDAFGQADAILTNVAVGIYKLVEVSAPGGPYEPFPVRDVEISHATCNTGWIRNLHNILLSTSPV
jgi:Prealbumin-like fold domain/Coenzyme PQQ synthesis protein D (PqqD)